MTNVRSTMFPWRRSADQAAAKPAHHPVVIVGAGPVGLVAALGLAQRGHASSSSTASRPSRRAARPSAGRSARWRSCIAWGSADLAARGVTWQRGRVFFREREVYAFDLLPEQGHRWPAFINLQQYLFEHRCIGAAARSAASTCAGRSG